MVTRRIIPDAYTEYEDGHLGVVPASLANVEAKIGKATGGTPFKVYTLAGPDAKNMAKTIFKSGPLLNAVEEAFDAGSTRIHAVRIGTPDEASLTLKDMNFVDALKLRGVYGEFANSNYANVKQSMVVLETGYAIAHLTDPLKVVFYDGDFVLDHEVEMPAAILSIVGVAVQDFPKSEAGDSGFWVLGSSADGPHIFHFDEDRNLVGADTIDLAAFVDGSSFLELVKAPMMSDDDELIVSTNDNLFRFNITEPGVVELDETSVVYGDLGTPPTLVGAVCMQQDLAGDFSGEDTTRTLLMLDVTDNKIFGLSMPNDSPNVELGSVDISTLVGPDTAAVISYDQETGEVLLGINVDGLSNRMLRLSIDWDAVGGPEATLIDEDAVPEYLSGMTSFIASVDCTTTITLQDRAATPEVERVYSATGDWNTVTALIAQAVNDGGVYVAELLVDNPTILWPSMDMEEEGGGGPDPSWFDAFTDGADGGDLTNGDYLNGLEATKSKTDTNWIHAVGATTSALWTAILLHCTEMEEDHHAERFAILETPAFISTETEGSAGYLSDLQDYVDAIVVMADLVGDRNAVIFAGGAQFMDSDGETYNRSITAACGGTMAGLEVQKSLINKPVRNVLKLVPEFSVGHIQTLIQARVNCIRFKPGRGYIITHSLTAAAEGSDYSRANDLRAVYYGSKAAREAAQPYVGEENDTAGEGLRRLESAMSRPLEVMRDGGQIDDFDLVAVSTANDRLLGDVYVSLGIQPRRAMEMIYTTVYLK